MPWALSTCDGSAPRPSVNTGGCSTIHSSSGVSGVRASVNARIAAKLVSYGSKPRSMMVGVMLKRHRVEVVLVRVRRIVDHLQDGRIDISLLRIEQAAQMHRLARVDALAEVFE